MIRKTGTHLFSLSVGFSPEDFVPVAFPETSRWNSSEMPEHFAQVERAGKTAESSRLIKIQIGRRKISACPLDPSLHQVLGKRSAEQPFDQNARMGLGKSEPLRQIGKPDGTIQVLMDEIRYDGTPPPRPASAFP